MASNDYPGQTPLEENSVWKIQVKTNGNWKLFETDYHPLRGMALDRIEFLRDAYRSYEFRLIRITTGIYVDGEP